jgi:hypothetical protein
MCLMAAGLVAALTAGCGASAADEQAQNDSSASGSSSSYQVDAAASTTTAQPAARRHRKPWYRRGLRTVGFQSPTGNIRCGLESDDDTQLLCKTLNNKKAVDLDDLLRPDTDITATISREPTLEYGRVWSSPNFYCWSEITGVTCRSLYSRHGFEIDRDGVTELIWKAPVLAYGGGWSASSSSNTDGSGDFCGTHACIDNFDNGTGYTVQCADGTWSHSGGRPGACSWHGGEAGG